MEGQEGFSLQAFVHSFFLSFHYVSENRILNGSYSVRKIAATWRHIYKTMHKKLLVRERKTYTKRQVNVCLCENKLHVNPVAGGDLFHDGRMV